jgi:transcriptional regulator with XRE-family HTH domain
MSYEGDAIVACRKEKKIKQNQLAKILKMTAQFLGRIEKGKEPSSGARVALPLDKAKRLCEGLGMKPEVWAKARLKDEAQEIYKAVGLKYPNGNGK